MYMYLCTSTEVTSRIEAGAFAIFHFAVVALVEARGYEEERPGAKRTIFTDFWRNDKKSRFEWTALVRFS